MNGYNFIGILLAISAYPVFAFTQIHATKCPACGLCTAWFPNDYYWLSTCAGITILAIGANKNKKDKLYQIAIMYFGSICLIEFADRLFNFIPAGTKYPIWLLTYTTALCIGLILLRYFLKYLIRIFSLLLRYVFRYI